MILWVDVRDVAAAHVQAMERSEAANKRFFVTAGYFSNKEIAQAVSKNFPEYKDQLPAESKWDNGGMPDEYYGFDNSRSKEILGIQYLPFDQCVVETIKSLQNVGA